MKTNISIRVPNGDYSRDRSRGRDLDADGEYNRRTYTVTFEIDEAADYARLRNAATVKQTGFYRFISNRVLQRNLRN